MVFLIILQVLSVALFFMVVFCLYKTLTEDDKPKIRTQGALAQHNNMFELPQPHQGISLDNGDPVSGDSILAVDMQKVLHIKPRRAGEIINVLEQVTGDKEVDWFNLQLFINNKDHNKDAVIRGINLSTHKFVE